LTKQAGARLRKHLLRIWVGDATAQGVIDDGFRALMRAEAAGGGGCANELDALLAAMREAVATYGGNPDA
jgi:hypothetical protein